MVERQTDEIMNTQQDRKEIRIERKPYASNMLELHLLHFSVCDGITTIAVAENMSCVRLTPENEGMHLAPLMSMRPDEAQQFMDELWRAGIRPTEGHGSVGQLGAVQRHLEDMRTLVFKQP